MTISLRYFVVFVSYSENQRNIIRKSKWEWVQKYIHDSQQTENFGNPSLSFVDNIQHINEYYIFMYHNEHST